MTDREKLIELHKEAGVEWDYYIDECINEGKVPNKTYDEFHADHLLANGVIVPPCEVGTLVWCVWRTHELNIEQRYYVNQSSVIGFTLDQGVTKLLTGDYACHGAFLGNYLVEVCFTPEEAERKLKELKDNV